MRIIFKLKEIFFRKIEFKLLRDRKCFLSPLNHSSFLTLCVYCGSWLNYYEKQQLERSSFCFVFQDMNILLRGNYKTFDLILLGRGCYANQSKRISCFFFLVGKGAATLQAAHLPKKQ